MIKKGRLQVIALPPEEFILAEGETTVDETTRFCAHWRQPTRSELIEEGHNKAKVWSIPAASVREEDSDRDHDETFTGAEYLSTDKATEKENGSANVCNQVTDHARMPSTSRKNKGGG